MTSRLRHLCGYLLVCAGVVQAGPLESTYRVSVSEGQTTAHGTGVAFAPRHIATNSHVVGNRGGHMVLVANSLGTRQAKVIAFDPSSDVAILSVTEPLPDHCPIGGPPVAGQECQIVGFGRQGILRRGTGRVIGATGKRGNNVAVWDVTVPIESGDSGSGLFDSQGRLIGLCWGADARTNQAAATSASEITSLAEYWETQWCANGRCQPIFTRPQPSMPGNGAMIPVQPPKTAPAAPQQPAPQAPRDCPPCDLSGITARLDAQAKAIADLAASIKQQTPGPPGPAGPAGPAGAPGKSCECQPQTPTTEPEHVVVVADKSSPDYRRLAGFIADAKQHYSGVRVSDLPPFPIGTIPQLIHYRGGVPVKVYKGRREVEEVLARIRREEFPERF